MNFCKTLELNKNNNLIDVEKFMRSSQLLVLLLLRVCCLSSEAESVHWNQFRGPNGAGIAAGI